MQIPFQSIGHRVSAAAPVLLLEVFLVAITPCRAQETLPAAAAIEQSQGQPVPSLVRYQGALEPGSGKQLVLRFSIYPSQAGGSPLWQESQLVKPSLTGEYTVLLGAGSAIGLPQDLFQSGQPRWLGIAIDSDTAEERRTLLSSVPYAMKAADADSLGGQPASAFVTRDQWEARLGPASPTQGIRKPAPATTGITGVTAGAGLTGGGVTGVVTLAVDPTKVPFLATLNAFTKGATFAAETKVSGTSTDWMLKVVNNATAAAKGTLLAQAAGANLGIEGSAVSGFGVEGITATGTGVVGRAGDGFGGSFTNNSANWPTLTAANASGPGLLATAGTGTAGSFSNAGPSNPALLATNTAATVGTVAPVAVKGTVAGIGAVGINGVAKNGLGGLFSNNSITYAALAGENASPGYNGVGVYGSGNADGVSGNSPNGDGVYGSSNAGNGVNGRSATGNGLNGVSTSGYGVLGFAASNFGVAGESTYSDGVYGSSNYGDGVYGGSSNKDGVVGVTGDSSMVGVYGQYAGGSVVGKTGGYGGVWGDASAGSTGIIGTSDTGVAGGFSNKSTGPTVVAENYGTGTTHTLFHTLMATSRYGTCGFGGNGDLSCTGQVKSLVTTGSARTVETYAVQSSENWLEDFGSGKLVNGAAVIQLDPAFADAANTSVEYHVFLTPKGDAGSIFVTNESPGGFEVRESAHGAHSIAFDYRIVARRRGTETQRLVDVTDKLRTELEAANTRRRPAAHPTSLPNGHEALDASPAHQGAIP